MISKKIDKPQALLKIKGILLGKTIVDSFGVKQFKFGCVTKCRIIRTKDEKIIIQFLKPLPFLKDYYKDETILNHKYRIPFILNLPVVEN